MKVIARSSANQAAMNLLDDQSKWLLLQGKETKRLRRACQDYYYADGTVHDVGTALAFALGFQIIDETK